MDCYTAAKTPLEIFCYLENPDYELIGLKLIREDSETFLVGISWHLNTDSHYKNFHNMQGAELNSLILRIKDMKPTWSNELDDWLRNPRQTFSLGKMSL